MRSSIKFGRSIVSSRVRTVGWSPWRCERGSVVPSATVSPTSVWQRERSSNSDSSSNNRAKNLQYLESWVGRSDVSTSPSSSRSRDVARRAAKVAAADDAEVRDVAGDPKLRPLVVTGASYLLPTLRLDRGDDPASLSRRLRAATTTDAAASGQRHSAHVDRSLLLSSSPSARWAVPLVLDLDALRPDGSPHFVPVSDPAAFLEGVVDALQDGGVRVVAVASPPDDWDVRASGLPIVAATRSGATTGGSVGAVSVETLVQMVQLRRREAANEHDDEDDEEREVVANRWSQTEREAVVGANVGESVAETISRDDDDGDGHTATSSSRDGLVASSSVAAASSTLYHGNVRTGQQVSAAAGRSLIVVGSVHSGGEVLADGDVFVLGRLRGRALAGLAGDDPDAKILATRFDPELVCIGGVYTTVDDVTELGLDVENGAVMVTLADDGDNLDFQEIDGV